jgi:hypothetical protein
MNAWADEDPETVRLSIDTKATVLVGQYSRGGKSRGTEAVKAWDHDMRPREKLVPGGILEPVSGKSFLFFGSSNKTSDFLVDGLELWWKNGSPHCLTSNSWSSIWIMVRNAMGVGVNFCTA